MTVRFANSALVVPNAQPVGITQLLAAVTSSGNPAYLVLNALDRNEYTAGSTGATGSFAGNGHTLAFSGIGGDGRGAGLVFAYDAVTGRYYKATYGYLDQLQYNASASAGDVTSLSLFGTSNLSLANAYASNAFALMQADASGYLGSATIATVPGFTGTIPAQATPGSIAATAQSFVGHAWNMNGCWILASTIAAEAGAALPVTSTAIGIAGQASGEWIVAYNGPVSSNASWQSQLRAGEIVVIATDGGASGHITTIAAGSGANAQVIDNATFMTSSGAIYNSAHDGSSADIIIQSAHSAAQEFAGVAANSVVVYELDTPIVSATATSTIANGQSLASLATIADPASRAITQVQAYDTLSGATIAVAGGVAAAAHEAARAVTAVSLAALSFATGVGADTLEVRAFNGTYWGDWQALNVVIAGGAATPAPAASPPVLASQTPDQLWTPGIAVSYVLPAGTFTDPQGLALSYAATQQDGKALPSWLSFNAATGKFSGTPPSGAAPIVVKLVATDTASQSAYETFTLRVAAPPVLAHQTASQSWTGGTTVSFALPSGSFTDPQGQTLTYKATLASGQALPSWLVFDPGSATFKGTAPSAAQTLSLKVTATDQSGLSASETIAVAIKAAAPVLSHATAAQTWIDGQAVNFVVPSGTFANPSGASLVYSAYQSAGTSALSWLRFNPSTQTFSGTVPNSATGTIGISVVATGSSGYAVDPFTVSFAKPTSTVAVHH